MWYDAVRCGKETDLLKDAFECCPCVSLEVWVNSPFDKLKNRANADTSANFCKMEDEHIYNHIRYGGKRSSV